MEKLFAILLGISFTLIALFGFSVASGSGAHIGCVTDMFQKLQGSACPVTESPFALLSSHLGSLQAFVGNLPASEAGGGAATLFALLAFFVLTFLMAPPALPLFRSTAVRSVVAVPSHARAKRIRWTALHEMSPAGIR